MTSTKQKIQQFESWKEALQAEVHLRSQNYNMLRNFYCGHAASPVAAAEAIEDQYLAIHSPSLARAGRTQFLQAGSGMQIATSNSNEPIGLSLRFGGEDWLRFSFALSGDIKFDIGNGHIVEAEGGSATMCTYSPDLTVCDHFGVRAALRWASIVVTRREFASTFACDLNRLPPALADSIETGRTPISFQFNTLDDRSVWLLHEILAPRVVSFLKPTYIKCLAVELISLFINRLVEEKWDREQIQFTARQNRILAEARALIEQDMMVTMDLQSLAKAVGMSRSKLSEGFRQKYGETIQSFTHRLKMDRAYRFIADKEGSLQELAFLLGYTHPNNLSAAIKKTFGKSARQIRK